MCSSGLEAQTFDLPLHPLLPHTRCYRFVLLFCCVVVCPCYSVFVRWLGGSFAKLGFSVGLVRFCKCATKSVGYCLLYLAKYASISGLSSKPIRSKMSRRSVYAPCPPRKSQNSAATFNSWSKSSMPRIVQRLYGWGS